MASNFARILEGSYSVDIMSEVILHFENRTPKSMKIVSILNANFNNYKINFDIKVDVKYEKKHTIYIQCECIMDTIIRHLKIINILDNEPEIRMLEKAVLANSNLVPNIKKKDYDDEANAFLSCYYPLALESCINVPIYEIATEQLGFIINTDYKIDTLGMICLNGLFLFAQFINVFICIIFFLYHITPILLALYLFFY